MSNDGFAGSNHDVGSFSEVDEELRDRTLIQDANLQRTHECEDEYVAAMEAYFKAFAVSVEACPSNWPTAKKEREAKTINFRERIRFEKAKVRFEAAKLYVEAQKALINSVQSRGANVRAQAHLDGGPQWSSSPRPVMGERERRTLENHTLTTRCSECGELQYGCPSGVTCPNGHGDAEPIQSQEPPKKRRPF